MIRRLFVLLVAAAAALWPLAAWAQETTPVDQMSDFALWGIVGGAFSSVAVAVINRARWRSETKLAVFFLVCCVVAAGNAYVQRQLDWHYWSRALLLVIASGWITYMAARPAIKGIEARTG